MGEKLTIPQLAEMLEVDRSHVYHEEKKGRVIVVDGLVDTDHPQNRDFISYTLGNLGRRRSRRRVQDGRRRYKKKHLTPAPQPTPEPETETTTESGEVLTISKYAKLACVSREAVYQAERRGDIVFTPGGGVDRDREENREYLFASWDRKAKKMLKAGKVSGGWSFVTATPSAGGGPVALIAVPPKGRDTDLLPVVGDWQEWIFDIPAGRAVDPSGAEYGHMKISYDKVSGVPNWLPPESDKEGSESEGKDGET